jgi:hypothetical protein
MREQQLLELDALCRSKGIKLLIVRSYGLMGYMRVSYTCTVLALFPHCACTVLAMCFIIYAGSQMLLGLARAGWGWHVPQS